MTKTYHIVERGKLNGFNKCEHHYIHLPNGRLLVAVSATDEGKELAFLQECEPQSLPHPVYGGSDKLDPDHADQIAELSQMFPEHKDPDQRKAFVRTLNIRDIVKRLSALHKPMGLSVF